MKNLKKALALTIAAVSVFGTIASAELSFVNPVTTQLPLITETVHPEQNWRGTGYVSTNVYDYSIVDGALVMKTKDSITDFTNGGSMSDYGLNVHVSGFNTDNALEASSFGNTKVVVEFSLKETSNANKAGILQYYGGDSGNVNIMQVNYTDNSSAVLGSAMKFHYFNWSNGTNQVKFTDINGTEVQADDASHKMRLTGEINVDTNTYSLTLLDTVTNTVVFDGEKTLAKDVKYVRFGLWFRSKAATEPTIYKYEITREAAETENAAVTVSGDNLNATVDVYANTDAGQNVKDKKPATVILAQYDENDKFISCTSASGEYERVMHNPDQSKDRRGEKKTLTASMAKAENYSYAKLFVWDSTTAMNPLAEVYSNKTVD